MSSLAGQFAGILLASVPSENSTACRKELHGLESQGLRVIARICDQIAETEASHEYTLDLLGNDRPGIVHEITTVLANHNVNVKSLETVVEAASMGGGEIFKTKAELLVPEGTDTDALEDDIENLANDLMVNISFDK